MQLALFGSTGRVGSRVLEYALAEGHTVRALVRDPRKVASGKGLEVLQGDVLDLALVERTIIGAGAVISTVGGAGLEDPGDAQSQGMRNIVAAMTRLGVTRVLGVGNSSILDSAKGGIRLHQPGFPAIYRPVGEKHREAWEALKASTLDWTMACPPDMVVGERTGTYRTLRDRVPEKGAQISVEDAADFLLRELREGKHLRTRVGISY